MKKKKKKNYDKKSEIPGWKIERRRVKDEVAVVK